MKEENMTSVQVDPTELFTEDEMNDNFVRSLFSSYIITAIENKTFRINVWSIDIDIEVSSHLPNYNKWEVNTVQIVENISDPNFAGMFELLDGSEQLNDIIYDSPEVYLEGHILFNDWTNEVERLHDLLQGNPYLFDYVDQNQYYWEPDSTDHNGFKIFIDEVMEDWTTYKNEVIENEQEACIEVAKATKVVKPKKSTHVKYCHACGQELR